MIKKAAIQFILFSALLFSGNLFAMNVIEPITGIEAESRNQSADSLKWSIDYLNKFLFSTGEWYLTDQADRKPIKGVVNYAENIQLDTVVVYIKKLLSEKKMVYLIDRRPQDIRQRKEISGYISEDKIAGIAEAIKAKVLDSLNISNITVPQRIMENGLSKIPQVPNGKPDELLGNKSKDLPSEFILNMNKRISSLQFPSDMSDAVKDTIRFQLFTSYREIYNDSVKNSWVERVIFSYRSKFISELADLRIRAYKKLAEERNSQLLTAFNDKEVSRANDSLKIALEYLVSHAEADSLLIRLANLKGEKTQLWTANRKVQPIRMFLKNTQNDSLSVVLINNGKGEIKLVIDDGIKLTRFVESQNRTITFQTKAPDKQLQKVNLKKVVLPPWSLFGDGTVGFTQTSLSNWAKGGESSLALLIMSKYNANYSKDKVKWENNVEFRYGISQTKTRGLEKNDDKIELQSRLGYFAFKKWYYSVETNFRTQIARGYKFPEKQKPISAFMAPAYWTMSIGLDYKPNKNFSLFIAPFTSKTTYVLDTVLISPSKYGLETGKKKLWEPGIITKVNWHVNLMENVTYDTRCEFFNNYRYTLQKFAFEWEQVLIMKVNRSINARVMTQLIYDYNTKFPILDSNNKEIGREPKWQFKELRYYFFQVIFLQ